MKKKMFSHLLLPATMLLAGSIQAWAQDRLQELINSPGGTRATMQEYTIDLTAQGVSGTRTTTLYIDGVGHDNVRLINGTLTRGSSLAGPLVKVSGDCRLVIGNGCTLNGGSVTTATTNSAVVEVAKGIVNVDTGGKVVSGTSTSGTRSIVVVDGPTQAIRLSKDYSSKLFINGGSVTGGVESQGNDEVWLRTGSVDVVTSKNSNIDLYGAMQISGKIDLASSANFIYLHTKLSRQVNVNVSIGQGVYLSELNRKVMESGGVVVRSTGVTAGDYVSTSAYTLTSSDANFLALRYYGNRIANNRGEPFMVTSDGYIWGDGISSLENGSIYLRFANATNTDPTRTIEVNPAGSLPEKLPESEWDYVQELTLSGYLNSDDIHLIRKLTYRNLRKLDISRCSIVSGGNGYSYAGDVKPQKALIEVDGGMIFVSPDYPGTLYTTSTNTISLYMFAGCTNLEELILPNTVTIVEEGAFVDCPKLKKVVFGSGVTHFMSGFLFYASFSLSSVSFTQTTTASRFVISDGVIYNRAKTIIASSIPKSVKSLTIPSSVDSITQFAFAGCNSLTSVQLPYYMHRISNHAFAMSGLRSIDIPSGVTEIGIGSFNYCQYLTEVSFPESLELLCGGAFANCNLRTVDLSMTKVSQFVGDYYSVAVVPYPSYAYYLGMFENNSSLSVLKLPATIKSVGGKTTSTDNMRDVYSYNVEPPTIWFNGQTTAPNGIIAPIIGYTVHVSNTFHDINYSRCTLHVPKGSLNAYKSAWGWKEFYTIVDDLPASGTGDISDASSLQKALDDIAARGKATEQNPETIVIPTGGITIDRTIYVRNGCHAVITGGNITLGEFFEGNAAFQVEQGNTVTFQDITLDLNRHAFSSSYNGRSGGFICYGALTFGNNFRLVNVGDSYYDLIYLSGGILTIESGDFESRRYVVYAEDNTAMSSVFINGGNLKALGSFSVIEGNCTLMMRGGSLIGGQGAHYVVNISGEAYVYDGTVTGASSNILIHTGAQSTYSGGLFTGGYETHLNYGTIGGDARFNVATIQVYHPANIDGNCDLSHTILNLNGSDVVLHFFQSIKHQVILTANWSSFPLNKPIVMGSEYGSYKLNQVTDVPMVTFKNLPSNLETYYNSTDRAIELRKKEGGNDNPDDDDKKDGDWLQWLVDHPEEGEGKGTEDDPLVIPIDPSGIDVDKNVEIPDKLQALIDGLTGQKTQVSNPESLPNYPWISFSNGGIIIKKTAGLTLRNIGIDGKNSNNWFEIYGKLKIDINVVIRNFPQLVFNVREGGTLIWDGGIAHHANWWAVSNSGTLILKRGRIGTNGEGKLLADNHFELDGTNFRLGEVELARLVKISLTNKLAYRLKVIIENPDLIKGNYIFMQGTNGYRLTQSDLNNLDFDLSADYKIQLDQSQNVIIIRKDGGNDDPDPQSTTIAVTTSADGYATFYDSQKSYSLPQGVTASTVTAATSDKIVFTDIRISVVPKGLAVMLKGTPNTTYTLTSTTQTATYSGTNLLYGSDVATTTTAPGNNYYYKLAYGRSGTRYANVFGWYWGRSDGSAFQIAGHRAWLAIPRPASSRPGFAAEDGSSLDIDASMIEDADGSGEIFDLQGRRINSQLKKGIYIKNGKKIVNK